MFHLKEFIRGDGEGIIPTSLEDDLKCNDPSLINEGDHEKPAILIPSIDHDSSQ